MHLALGEILKATIQGWKVRPGAGGMKRTARGGTGTYLGWRFLAEHGQIATFQAFHALDLHW